MEALILSCSTGGGHNSAANAVANELKELGVHVTLMDPYTLQSDQLAREVGKVYVDLVQFSPWLFGEIYKLGALYERVQAKLPIGSPVLQKQKKTARLLYQYLQQHPVDVIVCTHMYPGMMITQLKNQGLSIPLSMLVTTDYTCIPFETQAHCDWTTIGARQIEDEFLKWKMNPHQLLPFGIPVGKQFEQPKDKLALRRKFDLDPSARLVLLAGGSMGTTATDQLARRLLESAGADPQMRLVVVCGQNQKLFDSLQALNNRQLRVLGYVDNMDEWLGAADVYITKPGGLSITEACTLGIPLILVDPIPGCETANAHFFEKEGMACYARNFEELLHDLDLLKDPARAARMMDKQKHVLPHHASERIARFARMIAEENSSANE